MVVSKYNTQKEQKFGSLTHDYSLFWARKLSNIIKLIILLSVLVWKCTSRALISHITINILQFQQQFR